MQNSIKPFVSVVLPVYNGKATIQESINSVLNQSYKNFELIIIDDGSTDGTCEVVQEYNRFKNIRCLRNEKNKGIAFSINKGVNLARGYYIMRMDADDLIHPDKMKIQLEYMENNPNVDVLGTGYFRYDSSQNRIISINIPPISHNEICKLVRNFKDFIIGPNFKVTNGTIMAKREWLLKNPFDPMVKVSQDKELFARTYKYSIFANINLPLYLWKVGGTTKSINSRISASLVKMNYVLKFYRKNESFSDFFIAFSSAFFSPLFFVLYAKVGRRLFYKKTLKMSSFYYELFKNIHQSSKF